MNWQTVYFWFHLVTDVLWTIVAVIGVIVALVRARKARRERSAWPKRCLFQVRDADGTWKTGFLDYEFWVHQNGACRAARIGSDSIAWARGDAS